MKPWHFLNFTKVVFLLFFYFFPRTLGFGTISCLHQRNSEFLSNVRRLSSSSRGARRAAADRRRSLGPVVFNVMVFYFPRPGPRSAQRRLNQSRLCCLEQIAFSAPTQSIGLHAAAGRRTQMSGGGGFLCCCECSRHLELPMKHVARASD